MKIASKIKPRDGKHRRVTVHGRLYIFAPTIDRNEEKHFVAEVKDERTAETLLTSGHFYHFSADLEPEPVLQRASLPAAPPAPPAPPPAPAPAPIAAGESQDGMSVAGKDNQGDAAQTVGQWPPDVFAAATELLKGSAAEISSAVGQIPAGDTVKPSDVVKAARAIEASGEKPRANVLKLLDSTLEGLKTAGLA